VLAVGIKLRFSQSTPEFQAFQFEKAQAWGEHQHHRSSNEVSQPLLAQTAYVAGTLCTLRSFNPL